MMENILMKLMRLKAKGFCCAQIILNLALESQGKTNADLVRSMGGLCFGVYAGEVCGALTGGVCLISLYAGKGDEEESAADRYVLMVNELVEWFRNAAGELYGGLRCNDILVKYPDRSICGRIVTDTYEKCVNILVNHGFDPVEGR